VEVESELFDALHKFLLGITQQFACSFIQAFEFLASLMWPLQVFEFATDRLSDLDVLSYVHAPLFAPTEPQAIIWTVSLTVLAIYASLTFQHFEIARV
jgi:hypothetical protein